MEYRDLVENLQFGIGRALATGRLKFEYMNIALREMLQVSPKAIRTFTLEDLFGDKRQFNQFRRQIKAEGAVRNFEARLRTKKKRALWGSVSANIIYDKAKKPKYVDFAIEDISIKKLYEKELVESKELFQTVFKNTAAAIIVTDKNEKIVAWNPFTEKLLSATKEDLFNRPVRELYSKEEWNRIRSFQLRKTGMKANIETQIYKTDDTQLDVDLSLSVLKDLDGNVIGTIGIMRDITQQKEAERKIRESEATIRIILDNSAAVITLTDEQERIVSWNKFTEHLLGYKKEDLYLKPIRTLYPEEEWQKIRRANIRELGSKHHLDIKVIKKDGSLIDVDLSVNILKDDDGRITGSVGIMQDVTEQKRAQEMLMQAKLAAEEANNAKSLFLANMSHEVRTPMNTIMGMLDLTLDTELSQEQRENISVAKDASVNLLSLLNDILDLSRVEAGKITLEDIEFHLHNIAKSIIKGMQVLARDKNLAMELDIQQGVPELLKGDPVRIRQVIINLINNAIKFTPKGTIRVEIKVAASPENDFVTLLFGISDQGVGIPKDKQSKIFDIFSQADDSTTRRFGGTGLGLAISKRLVEMMGGRIWVESEEGKGSTFYFTANFKIVKQATAALPELDSTSEINEEFIRKNLKGIKVLLAEDNVVNQKITIKLLEKVNWQVETVENGKDAVERYQNSTFDLILMDANMPELDGLEATKLIRDNECKTGKHIPIIALTARAMEEDKRKCLNAGMDGYIAKPIDRRDLYTTIATILKKGQ